MPGTVCAAPSRKRSRPRRCAGSPSSSQNRSLQKRTARGTRAREKPVSRDAAMRQRCEATGIECFRRASRQRHREDAPVVGPLLDLLEAGVLDELIELGLGAAPHDPRAAAAVAGERARNQLELRMPGLAGVDRDSRRARRRARARAATRLPAHCRGRARRGRRRWRRRTRLDRGQALLVESVRLDEARDRRRVPSAAISAVPSRTLISL